MHSKTLPTLNEVLIECTVHYILQSQCTFSLSSLVHMKVRDSDILAQSSRDDRAMKKYSTYTLQYHVQFEGMTLQ